jgi:hypothetical protein
LIELITAPWVGDETVQDAMAFPMDDGCGKVASDAQLILIRERLGARQFCDLLNLRRSDVLRLLKAETVPWFVGALLLGL